MSPAPERVLFLAPFEPWCRENGSSVIIADLLEALVSTGRVEVLPLFLRDQPRPECAKPASMDHAVRLGIGARPKWVSMAASLTTGRSPLRVRFDLSLVTRLVLAAVRARGFAPTVVHAEHLALVDSAKRIAEALGCPLVYRAHNIESQLWARRFTGGGPIGAGVRRWVADQEIESCATAARTLCISETDAAWVRARAPQARVDVLEASIRFSRFAPVRDATAPVGRQICFVGGLEWEPNEVGLRWFVERALPRILREVPDATLALLARGADSRPWLTQHPAVRIQPSTAQAPLLFGQSAVSVAPLLQGGGVRIKILESLAMGCPVVATGIGGEGLALQGLTTADDPDAFADACVRQLRHVSAGSERGALARAAAAHHDADAVAGRLVDFWADSARVA